MSEETFASALENRILLFDGAMGTEIQRYEPKSEDFPDGKDGFNAVSYTHLTLPTICSV